MPPGVVTLIVPVAPLPTIAVICVELSTMKLLALVPPNWTIVAPVKFVPVITIDAPVAPLVGVKEDTVGVGIYVNVPELVPVPPGVVTLIVPDVPFPTVAVIWVALFTV